MSAASKLVALGEPDYPQRLQMIDDAPPLLAVRGKLSILPRPLVAIVGSRNASAAGVKFADRLARDLGAAGYGIVSGLARGIDAAAHRASLASGTIAVLAGGHDRIYPAEHIDLLDHIVAEGAGVSEMPLTWEPRARDFPRRNRLISGLSIGVVIVEAARRSGSLITAGLRASKAAKCSRCRARRSTRAPRGTNGLLKQGATLVTEAADVIAVLEPIWAAASTCRRANRHRTISVRMIMSPPRTTAPVSSRCSARRPPRSTIWCACRAPRRPSCARCCWNSKSPAGWSGTAAHWYRWYNVR